MPKHDKPPAELPPAPEPATTLPDALGAPKSPAEVCRVVEQVVEREPRDRVRCAHLYGDYYRCNWWSRVARPKDHRDYDWANTLTDHVRQSRFLRVTVVAGGVEVRPVTARSTGGGAD